MNWIQGETVYRQYLSGKLHEETQVEEFSVSLTASSVYELQDAGHLDFGGSEFQLGDRTEIEPVKRNEDDDYGWWDLSGGSWILELNENVTYSEEFTGVLQPHDHLTWNGATHPTLWLTSDDSDARLLLPLQVPSSGLKIKENARVTSLKVSRRNEQ
jgi:hypothetical protein